MIFVEKPDLIVENTYVTVTRARWFIKRWMDVNRAVNDDQAKREQQLVVYKMI